MGDTNPAKSKKGGGQNKGILMPPGYHSRKYQVAMGTIIATSILAATGNMTGDVATVFTGANIAFHAANFGTHWAKK